MAGFYKHLARKRGDHVFMAYLSETDDAATFETSTMAVYLAPAEFIDSDHPSIIAVAGELCHDTDGARAAAQAIYRFVRDFTYEGDDFEDLEIFRASTVLAAGHGYCVSKASLGVALARAVGIPARIGFADVRNHLASPRLLQAFGTDTFAWHGYVELCLGASWVKVSPTFDAETCRRSSVALLEFDGVHDALLQAFDGDRSMDYVKWHGTFHDVPARFLAAEMLRLYPFARDHGISRFKATRTTS
jgi:transglutaminase-like putative cysteine protease